MSVDYHAWAAFGIPIEKPGQYIIDDWCYIHQCGDAYERNYKYLLTASYTFRRINLLYSPKLERLGGEETDAKKLGEELLAKASFYELKCAGDPGWYLGYLVS